MNNASLGMPPAMVVEAVASGYEAISREPLHGKHDLQDQIAQRVVPGLARLLGANPDEVSLTRNATEALHLQAVGLDLEPGDEVILTTQEHPAGLRPWLFRAERHGIQATDIFVPSPLEGHDHVVELFERAITPRTRAIAFCHVTRGGHLYPVKRLAEMARSHGLLSLVDGAQALGQFPVDLHDLGCDAYSASLHKWLLGPVGTGILYVRESARTHVRSAFAHDATLDAPALAPPGTADFPLRAGLDAALAFAETVGLDNVAIRNRYLSDYFKGRLSAMAGVTLLSGNTAQTSCPGSTIFEMEGVDAMALVPVMDEQHSIHLDEHQRDGHNAIRISTHIYNTTAGIDRLVAALEHLT
jgi:selenocysteine lyase/cysteine desulfurase